MKTNWFYILKYLLTVKKLENSWIVTGKDKDQSETPLSCILEKLFPHVTEGIYKTIDEILFGDFLNNPVVNTL